MTHTYLNFSSGRFVRLLSTLTFLLVLLHIISLGFISYDINPFSEVLVEKFSLEGEGNFPAFFSAFILLLAAVLFLTIGSATRLKKEFAWGYWFGLAVIFFFLSLDEATQIHEKLDTDLIWSSFNLTGLVAWPWVILYGSLSLCVGIFYFRFWLGLPGRFRFAFALAAAVYVGSALGFEMLEALEYTTQGGATARFVVLTSLEEIFEMTAIVYLIATQFKYLHTYFPVLHISLTQPIQ